MLQKPKAIPQRLPAGPGTKISPALSNPELMVSGAAVPTRVSLAKPPSNPTSVPSKFRTGPAMVISSSVQVLPPEQSAFDWQGAPGFVPPLQTPGMGEPGSGNFR